MKSFVVPTQKNSSQVRVAALMLLLVALVIPQLAWADHASDHPISQFEEMPSILARQAYAALVEKYQAGELCATHQAVGTTGRSVPRPARRMPPSLKSTRRGKWYITPQVVRMIAPRSQL